MGGVDFTGIYVLCSFNWVWVDLLPVRKTLKVRPLTSGKVKVNNKKSLESQGNWSWTWL